jgi:hypothetical protein
MSGVLNDLGEDGVASVVLVARSALGTATTNYMLGGDLMTELESAESEINFTMGF